MIKGAMSEVDFLLNLESYRHRDIVVYCTVGYRSGIFSKKLKDQGFYAYNLIGGVLLWSHMSLPCLLYTSPSPRDRG